MAHPSFPNDRSTETSESVARHVPSRRAARRIGLLAAVVLSVGGAALGIGCGSEDGNVNEAPEEKPNTKADSGTTRPSTDAGKQPRPEPDPEPDPEVDAGQPDAGQPEGGLQPDGTCLDPNDPGDTDAGALKLPDTDDDQDEDRSIFGVLNGQADVDQYTLSMMDLQGHVIGKGFTAVTPDVEVCVYTQCKAGRETTVSCGKEKDGGAAPVKKLNGWSGCCATNADVPLKWDCKGVSDNDSTDFIIRASQTKDACTSYEIKYTF